MVDGSGAAVTPGSGSVTFDNRTEEFDCTRGMSGTKPDGGVLTRVVCNGNKLLLTFEQQNAQISLNVTQAAGTKAFNGNVALTYKESGRNVCGSTCMVAAHNVTLQ